MGEDNMNGSHDEEMDTKLGERATNYIKELIREKHQLDPAQTGNAMRLLDDEIKYIQTKGTFSKDRVIYLNVYKDKPVKISAKVLVPVKEHPKFNFLGKLLGPKGNSLKRLQEDTMTKMSILGRGSMKDKEKEEELRSSLDPKYAHLSDDLHVEVTSFAPPAEAYARLAYALAELKKYLVPDSWDEISTEQRREAGMLTVPGNGGRGGRGGMSGRGGSSRGGGVGPIRGRGGGQPGGRTLISSTRPPPGQTQGPPSRALLPTPPIGNKVLSILDKARQAMNPDPPPHQAQYHQEDSSYYDGPPSSVHQMDYGHSQPSASDSYYNHPPDPLETWKSYQSAPFTRRSHHKARRSEPIIMRPDDVSSYSNSRNRADKFKPYKRSNFVKNET